MELTEFLEQNFLRFDFKTEVPSKNHRYLSSNIIELLKIAMDCLYVLDPKMAGDPEKLREWALLREFKEYVEYKKKRLKILRLENVRTGLKKLGRNATTQPLLQLHRRFQTKFCRRIPNSSCCMIRL